MKTGIKGIELIKSFESAHDGDKNKPGLQPEMDPVGIWTEGFGRAMRDDKGAFIKGASKKALAESRAKINNIEQAVQALLQDLVIYENIVLRKVKVKLTQNQFDALVCHTYNTGGSDTLFKLINQKAPEDQIYKWFTTKYVTGQGSKTPLAGLVRRRQAEAKLFFS